ncbi:hypothetical protein P692DRAFT_20837825 [Suillus brevipes Sb2]|nr:hypothetical protein P692DRAFT_20837825 [Suillus brevipes Sb2]
MGVELTFGFTFPQAAYGHLFMLLALVSAHRLTVRHTLAVPVLSNRLAQQYLRQKSHGCRHVNSGFWMYVCGPSRAR